MKRIWLLCGWLLAAPVGCAGPQSSGESASAEEERTGVAFETTVAARDDRSCAIDDAGTLLCWGEPLPGFGEAPDDSEPSLGELLSQLDMRSDLGEPEGEETRGDWPLVAPGTFRDVTIGGEFVCAMDAERSTYCWGGSSDSEGARRKIGTLSGASFVDIEAGESHVCGRRDDGRLSCWGLGRWEYLPEGRHDHDQAAPPEGAYRTVAAGVHLNGAIRDDGRLRVFGGAASTSGALAPDDFSGSGTYRDVSVGLYHACGIRTDGRAVCWGHGSNPDRWEGEDDYDQSVAPQAEMTAVAVGTHHTCGITVDGEVTCWGAGTDPERSEGELDVDQASPPDGHFAQIAAGEAHTCGVRPNGELACWGRGDGRQRRDDPATNPTRVPTSDRGPGCWATGGSE